MYYILLQNVTTLLWQLHFVKFCQTIYYILLQNVNVRKTKRDLMVGFEPRDLLLRRRGRLPVEVTTLLWHLHFVTLCKSFHDVLHFVTICNLT